MSGRQPAKDPRADAGIRNCSCETRPGVVVDGPEAGQLVAAFERDHGEGGACGCELVWVPLSKMGRAG